MRTLRTAGLVLWVAVGASACATGHRLRRFVAPTTTQVAAPSGALAQLEYVDGDGVAAPYQMAPGDVPGLSRPMLVDTKGRLAITPTVSGTALRIYVRHTGLQPSGYRPVVAVTGTAPDSLSDEVRFLPRMLPTDQPTTIALADLANVYSGDPMGPDDIVVVELQRGQAVDRYTFVNRRLGWKLRFGVDALVRTPLPYQEGVELAPALTGGLGLSYTSADRGKLATLLLDELAVVGSVGIGTSTLDEVASEDEAAAVKAQQALSGLLVGGGIKVMDVVSVQALVNADAMTGNDPVWALGVGVDVAGLTAFTRYAATRLFYDNGLDAASEDWSGP